jgi:hypothetical protein
MLDVPVCIFMSRFFKINVYIMFFTLLNIKLITYIFILLEATLIVVIILKHCVDSLNYVFDVNCF